VPPVRQQDGDTAAEYPHHVLVEQVSGDVVDIGHREQRQVRGREAAFLCYLCEVVQDRLVVTHRRGQHRPAVACR
jgi:hypothetical protein